MAESTITDWIQAFSALAGVLGLAVYAWDTRKIRNATLAQSEASRRPFLETISKIEHLDEYCLLVNSGAGIALSFAWRYTHEPSAALRGSKTSIPVRGQIGMGDAGRMLT